MIRLVAMDVDGTLTDGGIYMGASGEELKRFGVRDGYGIAALVDSGVEIAFISGRSSESTERRAAELGVKRVVNGTRDKLPAFISIAESMGISRSETVFIGDDIPDIPCIKWAGLGVAVADASEETRRAADMVTSSPGGRGAVREVCEYVLRLNGREGE
ncbi:MAG: HAD-IIIA family hydrolase [Synergistaceae bacterium]|jgi:3-deoxy-D-manno-octulosonate 8-phosphate phosphatase (KDO 8-P phosphatase)|nr:HAD-IIIA family hydrolase [Synergistaceae bacterium]